MDEFDELEQQLLQGLDELAGKMNDVELDNFTKELAKKYNIDVNCFEGYYEIKKLGQSAVFLNYFTDIQFLVFKNYLINKMKRDISNHEALEIALNMPNPFYNKFLYYSASNLNWIDKAAIYQDMNILSNLYDLSFFNKFEDENLSKIINDFKNYNYDNIVNRHTTLGNIKTKLELNKIGLQEFSENQVKELIKK